MANTLSAADANVHADRTQLMQAVMNVLLNAIHAVDRGGRIAIKPIDNKTTLDAITSHPVLLERPIVVRGGRAVIARPPERLLDLL